MSTLTESCVDIYNATVNVIFKDATTLKIHVYPDGPMIPYKAGQYAALGLMSSVPRCDGVVNTEDKMIKRAYSISAAIWDEQKQSLAIRPDNYYEFYIDLVPQPDEPKLRLTPRLFSLTSQDRIFLGSKIVGHYCLPDHVNKNESFLFIGTTTGEAPHNAMIQSLLSANPQQKVTQLVVSDQKWASAYGAQHQSLMSQYPNYRFLLTDCDESYHHFSENISQVLKDSNDACDKFGFDLDPSKVKVYLCGDPKLVGAPIKLGGWQYEYPDHGLMRLFTQYGFEMNTRFKVGQVYYETYW